MKQKKVEKKLKLNKTIIEKLQAGLNGEELNEAKGGAGVQPMGTTNIPPLCT